MEIPGVDNNPPWFERIMQHFKYTKMFEKDIFDSAASIEMIESNFLTFIVAQTSKNLILLCWNKFKQPKVKLIGSWLWDREGIHDNLSMMAKFCWEVAEFRKIATRKTAIFFKE